MLDLILAGPGVTPDLVCDLADEFMAGEVLTRPNAARFCGLSPMTARSIARRLADDESIDVLEVKAGLSVWDFRVICLDMDGTVIQNECIDDMAALHGVGEEVSSVTRAAMEGGTKLTFAESLEKRVAFLKGRPRLGHRRGPRERAPAARRRTPHRLLQRPRHPQLRPLGRLPRTSRTRSQPASA